MTVTLQVRAPDQDGIHGLAVFLRVEPESACEFETAFRSPIHRAIGGGKDGVCAAAV